MQIFILTNSDGSPISDTTAAAVTSMSDATPVDDLGNLVLGDSVGIELKFTTAAGTAPAFASAATSTPILTLGVLTSDGSCYYAAAENFTAITNGWSARLALTTTALVSAVNILGGGYGRPRGGWLTLQVQVTDSNGFTQTYAIPRVFIEWRVVAPTSIGQFTPFDQFLANAANILALQNAMAVACGSGSVRLKIVACAVRNTGSGWELINDSEHNPQGVASVGSSGDDIQINYNFTASSVVALVVVPDETLAALGLQCGASVGLSYSRLRLSVPFSFNINLDSAAITDTPSYVANKLTVADSGYFQRVTHAENLAIPISSCIGSSPNRFIDTISFNSTAIDIYQLSPLSGYIYYNGSSWVLQKNNRSTAYTAVWSTDHLVVTHDAFPAAVDQVNVTPFTGIKVSLGAANSSSFDVYFYDAAGTLITSPATSLKFWFNRPALAQVSDLSGYLGITRGQIAINSADITSASGNLWIFGIFEN